MLKAKRRWIARRSNAAATTTGISKESIEEIGGQDGCRHR
jgi:hypothetical protein